jgi:carbon-monoxide dehydrogenase medium subunit
MIADGVYAAPFQYVTAASFDEAVEALRQHGDAARVIAGGQSLVPLMMLRLVEPAVLVDVRAIGRGTIEQVDGRLLVPALTRHVDLEESPLVRERVPALADAAACIGNVRVRHRGTIGGSLAHAEPTAELPCLAVALRASVHVLGPAGPRTIPAAELFAGYFATSLAADEVITAVEVPFPAPRAGTGFAELARRAGDFASAEAAAVVALAGDGTCADVALAVGAVADRPLDVSVHAASLCGAAPDADALAGAAQAVADAVELAGGGHGSPAYRRRLLRVVVRRALEAAAARAGTAAAA